MGILGGECHGGMKSRVPVHVHTRHLIRWKGGSLVAEGSRDLSFARIEVSVLPVSCDPEKSSFEEVCTYK